MIYFFTLFIFCSDSCSGRWKDPHLQPEFWRQHIQVPRHHRTHAPRDHRQSQIVCDRLGSCGLGPSEQTDPTFPGAVNTQEKGETLLQHVLSNWNWNRNLPLTFVFLGENPNKTNKQKQKYPHTPKKTTQQKQTNKNRKTTWKIR